MTETLISIGWRPQQPAGNGSKELLPDVNGKILNTSHKKNITKLLVYGRNSGLSFVASSQGLAVEDKTMMAEALALLDTGSTDCRYNSIDEAR